MTFKKVGVKDNYILYTHTAEFLVHALNTDIDTLSLSPVSSHKCINTRSGQGKVFQVCKPEITVGCSGVSGCVLPIMYNKQHSLLLKEIYHFDSH